MKRLIPAFLAVIIFSFLFTTIYAQDATESADTKSDTIREKVQEKIDEVRSNPKAFMGVVTDITDLTIQTKNAGGEIQQVSVSKKTNYVKVNGKSESLDFEDLAIGDHIVALGFKNGTEVLESSRILITTEPPAMTRKSVFGVVGVNEDDDLTVKDVNGKVFLLEPTRNVDVLVYEEDENTDSKVSNVEEGDVVIAMGSIEGESLEARRIQIVKKVEVPSEAPEEVEDETPEE